MGFTIQWDDEQQTIVHVVYDDHWSWDDYQTSMEQAGAMVRSIGHSVDAIFEFASEGPMPPGSPLTNFRRSLGQLPEYTGVRVIVRANAFIEKMAIEFSRRFAREMSRDLFFAPDLAQAYQIIAERRNFREREQ